VVAGILMSMKQYVFIFSTNTPYFKEKQSDHSMTLFLLDAINSLILKEIDQILVLEEIAYSSCS
jgi:hypothetical protein